MRIYLVIFLLHTCHSKETETSPSELRISIPSFGTDMSKDEIVHYSSITLGLFFVMVTLAIINRMRCLNVVTYAQIERELERQDELDRQNAIALGYTDPVKETKE